MVTELAQIDIQPGHEAAFEAAVAQARAGFASAEGFLDLELHRTVENPLHYKLIVRWARLEDHTVTFRNSAAFAAWRSLAGPHFASAPRVEHLESCRLD